MYNYICSKYTTGVTFVNTLTNVALMEVFCYHV